MGAGRTMGLGKTQVPRTRKGRLTMKMTTTVKKRLKTIQMTAKASKS